MTILERKVFISSNPRIVLSSCPPPCGHFSIQESATGGLSYKARKNSALQDSPPVVGRYKRHLPFRRSAILPGRAFYAIGNSNGISYSIKKALILQKDESCQHSLYHLLHCTGLHTQPIHAPCNGGIPLSPTCSFRDKTPE